MSWANSFSPEKKGKLSFLGLKTAFLIQNMCGPWDRMKTIADVIGCIHLASVGTSLIVCVFRSSIMSENELSTGESSSEGSEDVCSSDGEDYYVFNGDFAPYQGEPLASSEDGDNNGGGEVEDEDGILPSVLQQRFEGQVPLENW